MPKAALLIFVLTFAALATAGQTRSTRLTRSIDRYVKTLEPIRKARKPDLVMADTADLDKPSVWKRFASLKALDEAKEQHDMYTIAVSWKRNGKIAISDLVYTSPTTDWSQYVYQYFRPDGTLAMVLGELKTFTDECIVKQRFYFNSRGRRIRKVLEYFDLTTEKRRKPCPDVVNVDFEYFRSVKKLPFSAN